MALQASLTSVKMSDARFDQISDRIYKSYPNACIIFIKEIINPVLEENFLQRKEAILKSRGYVDEKLLFHGTKEQNIMNIASNGFDVNKNRVSAYGKGTYFARDASYSISYTDVDRTTDLSYMFLCRVLLGSLGHAGSNNEINTNIYDNSVDCLSNPSIVVTPYNSGALPNYIIAFYKNA